VLKDLRIARRYLPNLLGRIVELAVRIAFFFLLANTIAVNAESSPLGVAMTGHDLAIFFLGALLLFVFNTTALHTPVESVATDLYNGTLEYLFSNPASRYAYFVGTVMADGIVNLAVFIPAFAAFLIATKPPPGTVLLVLLACAAVLCTVVGIGVSLAILGILWRNVRSIVQVLAILFELLAGAYFPVSSFPAPMRFLAYALPYTWGYDLIRYYSFNGRWITLLPPWLEWLLLLLFAVVFLPISVLLLVWAERSAKRSGLHLI
jgi:ABC-2 type transport system permease protein